MKIEKVREIGDPEPTSLSVLINNGEISSFLYSLLFRDPFIEYLVGIEPDYDFITRLIIDRYSGEIVESQDGYDYLFKEIREVAPFIYKDSKKYYNRWKKSYDPDEIEWKVVYP